MGMKGYEVAEWSSDFDFPLEGHTFEHTDFLVASLSRFFSILEQFVLKYSCELLFSLLI